MDVLVLGETGTGKETIARSLHQRSRRSKERFVPVNAGAIPENLMESEFCGHEKGSFTGADQRSVGLLEFADKGTFFLDEVGELCRNGRSAAWAVQAEIPLGTYYRLMKKFGLNASDFR